MSYGPTLPRLRTDRDGRLCRYETGDMRQRFLHLGLRDASLLSMDSVDE